MTQTQVAKNAELNGIGEYEIVDSLAPINFREMTMTSFVVSGKAHWAWFEPVLITPELASKWLQEYEYPEQRSLRFRHVRFLAQEMKLGRFSIGVIRLVHEKGATSLTDGQHRLHGVVSSGVPIVEYVLHIETDGGYGAAIDYSHTDTGMIRTINDSIRPHRLSEKTSLTETQINALGAAINFIHMDFHKGKNEESYYKIKSRDVRVESILEWQKEARCYFGILEECDGVFGKYLHRAPVLAIALITLRYQEEKALKFWDSTARNDGLRRGQPEKTLLEFLLKNPGSEARNKPHHHYISNCWNAFYEARQIMFAQTHRTWSDAIILKGTPYKGKFRD